MLHVCMMRLEFCDQPTNQPTNKAILGVGFGDGKNDDGLTDVQTEFSLVDSPLP